jgi:nitrite reductase/ring-hydroxylating ferredoxin subunit
MTCETASWRTNRLAPAPGTSLGPMDAIADPSVREFQFGEGRRIFSMLVVRRGEQVRAYVNACPHVWLPLTFRSDRLLSEDGERLVCSNHLAEFAVDDGRALSGPVEPGCGLAAIPVHVNDRRDIVIGEQEDER